MKGTKNVVFLALTLGMLIYAVPHLEVGGGWTMPTVFGIAWIGFALLVVAAHLHEILGVDEETRRELSRVKHMKRWQTEQFLYRRNRFQQMKK